MMEPGRAFAAPASINVRDELVLVKENVIVYREVHDWSESEANEQVSTPLLLRWSSSMQTFQDPFDEQKKMANKT